MNEDLKIANEKANFWQSRVPESIIAKELMLLEFENENKKLESSNSKKRDDFEMKVFGALRNTYVLLEREFLIKRIEQITKAAEQRIFICNECSDRQALYFCIEC